MILTLRIIFRITFRMTLKMTFKTWSRSRMGKMTFQRDRFVSVTVSEVMTSFLTGLLCPSLLKNITI